MHPRLWQRFLPRWKGPEEEFFWNDARFQCIHKRGKEKRWKHFFSWHSVQKKVCKCFTIVIKPESKLVFISRTEKYSSFKQGGLKVTPAETPLALALTQLTSSVRTQWSMARPRSPAHNCVQLATRNWWGDLLEGRVRWSRAPRIQTLGRGGQACSQRLGEPSVGASTHSFLPRGSPTWVTAEQLVVIQTLWIWTRGSTDRRSFGPMPSRFFFLSFFFYLPLDGRLGQARHLTLWPSWNWTGDWCWLLCFCSPMNLK